MEQTDLQRLLDQAVEQGTVPGCVLLLSPGEGTRQVYVSGRHVPGGERTMRADDLFDLASLTKVAATTSIAMVLVDRGELDLDRPVADTVPAFAESAAGVPGRLAVTSRHLLAHCSGLPAYVPFAVRDSRVPPAEREGIVLSTPLEAAPLTAAVYSDIGMMIMGFILEELTGTSLNVLFDRCVRSPLDLSTAGFRPAVSLRDRIVPTECTGPSGAALVGTVHDENARWLGGVAGHAGLFAAVHDLARIADTRLNDGLIPGGRRLWGGRTLRAFTRRAHLVPASSRCLGWDSPGGLSSAGKDANPACYGHTGFTGTSMWIDPEAGSYAILLTNAVHPHRSCKEKGYFPWRRRVHDGAWAWMASHPVSGMNVGM